MIENWLLVLLYKVQQYTLITEKQSDSNSFTLYSLYKGRKELVRL